MHARGRGIYVLSSIEQAVRVSGFYTFRGALRAGNNGVCIRFNVLDLLEKDSSAAAANDERGDDDAYDDGPALLPADSFALERFFIVVNIKIRKGNELGGIAGRVIRFESLGRLLCLGHCPRVVKRFEAFAVIFVVVLRIAEIVVFVAVGEMRPQVPSCSFVPVQ